MGPAVLPAVMSISFSMAHTIFFSPKTAIAYMRRTSLGFWYVWHVRQVEMTHSAQFIILATTHPNLCASRTQALQLGVSMGGQGWERP